MAKEQNIKFRVEPALKAHVLEFYKTQPMKLSESIRDFLKKETKFKRKAK